MTRPYPAYRDSGVDWLGEVPAHWPVISLGRRYEIVLGKMLDTNRIGGSMLAPYLRNVDVQWGRINSVDLPEMDFSEEDREKFALRSGDLLVCEGGEVGRAAIWKSQHPLCFYQKALHRLRPLSSHADTPEYLFYVLRVVADTGLFQGGEGRSTIAHLPADVLRRYRFAFPPLAEQQAIAAFLDREVGKIDGLVEAQRRLIALLAEKRRAVISHAVTRGLNPAAPLKPSGVDWLGDIPAHWRATPLKHLADFRSGGTPAKDRPDYWDGSIPWISAKDLKSEELFAAQMSITEAALSEGAAALVPSGSVIILVRGMTLAHSFPVCVLRVPMAINQDLKALSGRASLVQNDFLAVALRGVSELCLARIDEAGHGTKALRMEAFTTLALPVPPLAEQAAILTYIADQTARLDALSAEAERAVSLLLERRAALISAAVTGKIDVRDEAEATEAA